jgi:hypothetical protein
MATDEEIRQVVASTWPNGEPFTVTMVARAAGASVQDVTTALASFDDGELLFQGKIEFNDTDGNLVGPAYAYRYFSHL